jgi:CDP-diacylglycerol--glycerol-3-phosphate 3-phosphatidyltransferase
MELPRTLRQRVDAQIAPLAARAAARGVTVDRLQWAILGLAAGVGALLLMLPAVLPGLHSVLLLLPAALAVRALASAVGDLLARDHPAGSGHDPALREVTDAGADGFLYLPLAAYPGVAAAPVVLLVMLGLVVEIAGLAPLTRGGERRRDGPMTRHDRAIVFAIVGFILAVDPRTAPWLPWLLLPAAALAVATVVGRLHPPNTPPNGPEASG